MAGNGEYLPGPWGFKSNGGARGFVNNVNCYPKFPSASFATDDIS